MVGVLVDTNVLIDFLRGIPAARTELSRHADKAISVITWTEALTHRQVQTMRRATFSPDST